MSVNSIGSNLLGAFGVGSFDVNALASAMATAEVASRKVSLEAQQAKFDSRQEGLDLLQRAFKGLQLGLSDLGSASSFTKLAANSANASSVSASITGKPTAATYNVMVDQLATSHSVASQAFSSQNSMVGEGTFSITVGGVTKDIEIGADNNSLSGLRDAINNAGLSVNASIVNDGSGYRLLMSSQQTGVDNAISVSVTDADGNHGDAAGLSRFASDNLTTTVAAQNASFSINGLAMTSNSNQVNGAVDGLSINLNKAEPGVSTSITIGADSANLKDNVFAMVEDFNAMMGIMDTLGSYSKDPEDPLKGSLANDIALRSARTQMREMLSFHISDGPVRSLADVGIMTNRDGTLDFDEARFNTMMEAHPEAVARMFSAVAVPSDAGVSFIGATDKTIAGNYSIDVSQAAKQASFLGNGLSGNVSDPITIDASNNSFTIKLNGEESATLTLAQGSFNRNDLASMLQSAINNDPTFKAKGLGVDVAFNVDENRFEMNSRAYGSAQSIELTSAAGNMASTLGLEVGNGAAGSSNGQDVAGSLKNAAGQEFVFFGTGQQVKITSMLPGSPTGLEFNIAGDQIGDRGTLNFQRGYAAELNNKINEMLDSKKGVLGISMDSVQKGQARATEQLKQLDDRYQMALDRYIKQFSAANQAMSMMNSLKESLSAQFNQKKD